MMRLVVFMFSLLMLAPAHAGLLGAMKAGMASIANPSHSSSDGGGGDAGSSYGAQPQSHSLLGGITHDLGSSAMGLGRYELGSEEAKELGGFNPYGYHPWGAGPAMNAETLYNDNVNAPGAVGTSGGGYPGEGNRGGYGGNSSYGE